MTCEWRFTFDYSTSAMVRLEIEAVRIRMQRHLPWMMGINMLIW